MTDFAETYREYDDDKIASIYGEIDSLLPQAREALMNEIRVRGLTDSILSKLQKELKEHTADVDKAFREEGRDHLITTALRRPRFGCGVLFVGFFAIAGVCVVLFKIAADLLQGLLSSFK